jgi:hypothetical protein
MKITIEEFDNGFSVVVDDPPYPDDRRVFINTVEMLAWLKKEQLNDYQGEHQTSWEKP